MTSDDPEDLDMDDKVGDSDVDENIEMEDRSILRSEMSFEGSSDMSLGLEQMRSEMSVDQLSEGPSQLLDDNLESTIIEKSKIPEEKPSAELCSELPSNYLPSNGDVVKYFRFKKLSTKSIGMKFVF